MSEQTSELEQSLRRAEPEWAYHLLFLHHSLNTSVNTFKQLLSFATQRGDSLVCDALHIMRVQWHLASGCYSGCQEDLSVLSSVDKTHWPSPMHLYFATLKVACITYIQDSGSTVADMKSSLQELHTLADAQQQQQQHQAATGRFEVRIAHSG